MTAHREASIRLTDERDSHLGFILMADEGCPLDVGVFEGECVFMPLPHDPSLFESEAYLLLAEHQDAGEHHYTVTSDGLTQSFTITGPLTRAVYVTLRADGGGDWGVRLGEQARRLGISHFIAAS